MGLDNYTKVVYGWQITGKSVKNITEDLEDICYDEYDSDIYDILEDFISEATMDEKYFYFGSVLVSCDAEEGGWDIIDDDLIKKKQKDLEEMLNKYPKIKEVFEYYKKDKKPQIYVFQQIW